MEVFLGITLIAFIPVYFVFVWTKGLLTLQRFILLVTLEIGIASTFLPDQKGNWIGSAAGAVLVLNICIPALLRWKRRRHLPADFSAPGPPA